MTAAHYHVFAVQDLGGTQECWRGWDDKFAAGEVSQHVNDVIRADVLRETCRWEIGIAEFGEDRYYALVSDNVAPGWDKVVAVGCADPCRFEDLFREQWEPHSPNTRNDRQDHHF